MTRTQAVLGAIQRELKERQPSLDGAAEVSEVQLTVRLQAGTTWVRGTEYREERVFRTRQQDHR